MIFEKDSLDFNYFLYTSGSDLFLEAECLNNDKHYMIEFKINDDILEINNIFSNEILYKEINYKYTRNKVAYQNDDIIIDLDYLFEFNDNANINFKFNQKISKNEICQEKYEHFSKLNDNFMIKYLEDLISSKQLYGNSDFVYDNGLEILNLVKKIKNKSIKCNNFSFKKEISYEKQINYIKEFFSDNNINIDLDELIKNKIIRFDYNSDGNKHGEFFYDNKQNKKLIRVYKRNDILFYCVMIHEIMHYLNHPESNQRTLSSEYLTEVVSYSLELIALDKFIDTDLEEDAMKVKINTLWSLLECSKSIYSPLVSLVVYKNNQKLTKEKIEEYLDFKEYRREIISFINNKNPLNRGIWDLIGYYLAIYNYLEYQKNPQQLEKIIQMNNNLNNKNIMDCLKIIGITNQEDIIKKGLRSIDEYIDFVINKEKIKKLNESIDKDER